MLDYLISNGPQLISVVVAVLTAAVAVSLLIPGEQPEKALQGILDLIKKFSLKK